jgi:hypothetical protein
VVAGSLQQAFGVVPSTGNASDGGFAAEDYLVGMNGVRRTLLGRLFQRYFRICPPSNCIPPKLHAALCGRVEQLFWGLGFGCGIGSCVDSSCGKFREFLIGTMSGGVICACVLGRIDGALWQEDAEEESRPPDPQCKRLWTPLTFLS